MVCQVLWHVSGVDTENKNQIIFLIEVGQLNILADTLLMKKIEQIVTLATCMLILVAVSAIHNGSIMGHRLNSAIAEVKPDSSVTTTKRSDVPEVIVTTSLAQDVKGYNGPVPLAIHLKDGKIQHIEALENNETPSFFGRASALLSTWDGMTLEEARDKDVDVVSGATFTSRAIIENTRRGMNYALSLQSQSQQVTSQDSKESGPDLSLKNICALLVVLMGTLIPLFWKNRTIHLLQLFLNVVVLGFWCTSFVSHSLILSFISGGLDPMTSYVPLLMLIVAFVYPLFGRKNHYCTHVCPLGAMQELTGKIPVRKMKISETTAKYLTLIRQVLWSVLILLMVTGIWSEWTNYEPFTAFALQSAEVGVIVFAALTLVVSLFVPRAYCRFVCPTGTLLKLSQNQR